MKSNEIREKYLNFWKNTPRNHKEVPNVTLVPEGDSTLLFVNSGMFPLAPYLSGQKHPLGKRLCNIQRCLRTKYDEMIEIGDNRHTLMFEMMGNWSLGDYFKEEQIPWCLELLVKHFGLNPNRLYVTVFGGDKSVPRDDIAINKWKEAFKKYGVEAEFSEDITNIPANVEEGKNHKYRIFPYDRKKNWWQRGEAPGELGGPSSEIFYDLGEIEVKQDMYHINDDSGRFIEIGNNVFIEYKLDNDMNWEKLQQRNIDFGGGFERIVMCVQDKRDIYETDIYESILNKVAQISGKEYKTNGKENQNTAAFRVIADHSRAATFILADGVTPSNKDQGYILRRFIRRLVRFGIKLDITENFTSKMAKAVIERLKDPYKHLEKNKEFILKYIEEEEVKFRKTLNKGLKQIEKIKQSKVKIDGKVISDLYQTHGFPFEMAVEELGISESQIDKLKLEFDSEEKKHREQSKLGAEKKFKGGLADHSEEVVKYHTATHLLNKALKIVLGEHVHQKGSNITGERLRFDFSHADKMTQDEIKQVEEIVNEQIKKDLKVEFEEMPYEAAKQKNIEGVFEEKYGELVKVYRIFDPNTKDVFSAELCGGPHVEHLSQLAEMGKFKITKEEAVSAGVRRIKAILAK